jgi:hypothetical protein
MKKILPYLLLNVAVSALTMLGVILIWNAFHPSPNQSDSLISQDSLTTSTPISLPSLSKKTVEIQSVFMPGEKEYEKISLKNVSDEPVNLTGWKVINSHDLEFTFPTLTLYPNGALDIYSKAGANSAVELYWNAPGTLWKSGEKAVLQDSAGQERSSYTIP